MTSARVTLAFVLAWLSAACVDRPPRGPEPLSSEQPLLPARVRRLDNFEYERTVSELVHKQEPIATRLPPDLRQEGYSPNDAQGVPVAWATRLDQVIAEVATRAADERLDVLAPCAADPAQSNDCAQHFVTGFGRRAYRRPLSSDEQQRLLAAFRAGEQEGRGFSGGVELVLRAALQSPNLLYLRELGAGGPTGTTVTLTSHEIASAMAYTIRGGPPDDALLDAADRGALLDGSERERHARRLLAQSDTRHQFRRFVLEWLEVDGLERTAKSAELFPEYDTLKSKMLDETRAFIDEVMVHGGASVRTLLAANFASVEPSMARFYGLRTFGPRASLERTRRVGVLQQASFLASHAHPDGTSPIRRGDFVMRKLLCTEVKRPAELGIETVLPPPSATHTTRERFQAHVADPSCRSCHSMIDPIGFTFEGFDAMGRARDRENGRVVQTGTRARWFGDELAWADSRELSSWLSRRPEVAECFARHAFRFFSAQSDRRVEESFLALRRSLPEARAGNLVEELVWFIQSDLFVKREVRAP